MAWHANCIASLCRFCLIQVHVDLVPIDRAEETPSSLKFSTDRSEPVNRFVQASMLTVMLLHSVLGCCWHHGHTHSAGTCQAGSSGDRSVPSRIQSTHSHGLHHTCSHYHGPAQSPADHKRVPHHHQCEQDDCHFMLAKSWEFPQQLELSLAFVTDLRVDVPQVLKGTLAAQDSDPVFDTAGSRCAVLQVWRI